MEKDYFVHETAIVDDGVTIGKDTKIWCFSHILKNTRIGESCVVGQNCVIGANVNIGNGVKIQNNISVYDGVEVEDDVFLGPSMVFTNVINPRAFIERKHEFKKTLMKKGCSVGANATIVCGTTIGKYSLIGAGSVVTQDVPDFADRGVDHRDHGIGDRGKADGVHLLLLIEDHPDERAGTYRVEQGDNKQHHDDHRKQNAESK